MSKQTSLLTDLTIPDIINKDPIELEEVEIAALVDMLRAQRVKFEAEEAKGKKGNAQLANADIDKLLDGL